MKYGLPYKGSKSSIAKWIVDTLPAAETFVDLFAGGCAVTHAAMLTDKWKTFVVNDICGSTLIFRDAIAGEYKNFSTVPKRNEFFASDDTILRLLYSFGNDRESYLWGDHFESIKVNASRMLSAPSLHERRTYYRAFMKEMAVYVREVLEERRPMMKRPEFLQGLEALERLQGLERLERLERLEVLVADYRYVMLPYNATVYADPPYRNTSEDYGGFDYDAFDDWLNRIDRPVYVSEYDAPRGCVCIAENIRTDHMNAYKSSKRVERIFIQEKFVDTFNKREVCREWKQMHLL